MITLERRLASPFMARKERSDLPNRFGEWLRAARAAKGVTQPALAEMADVDPSYISKLESGSKQPSRSMVNSLAAALAFDEDHRQRLQESGAAAAFLPSGQSQSQSQSQSQRQLSAEEIVDAMRKLVGGDAPSDAPPELTRESAEEQINVIAKTGLVPPEAFEQAAEAARKAMNDPDRGYGGYVPGKRKTKTPLEEELEKQARGEVPEG